MRERPIGSGSRGSGFQMLQCMAPIPSLAADTNVVTRVDRRRTPVLERAALVLDERILLLVCSRALRRALTRIHGRWTTGETADPQRALLPASHRLHRHERSPAAAQRSDCG